MRTIHIKFEIHNSTEVVKKQKGLLAGLAADLFLSRDKLKVKVENAVAGKLVEALQQSLTEKLTEEGVNATIVIEDAG